MSKILRAFSRHRVFTRAISMLLAILLTFYVIPTVIYAEIADAFSNIGDSTAGEEEITAREEEDEIYEDVSRREESVKHFRLSDGTYVAAQYPHPVHYTNEDGEYEDIDNTLSEASGGVYATPNARIKFAKKITGNAELFTLHDDNTKLRMSLVGAKGGVAGVVANGEDAEEATVLQKMMNLEKLVSRILYEDILDGVDVEYIAESLTVKENIIVKERKDSYSYSFELKLNGLTAALSDNGDVEIFVSGTNEIKYVIPAPVVYDADGVHAPEGVAYYTLADGGNGKYTLTVTVSSGWMNAEERAFPVTVDPTVGPIARNITDTEIDSNNQTTAKNSATTMTVSSTQSIYWKTINLPTVPDDAYIVEATLTLDLASSSGEGRIGAYKVTSDWAGTMTYDTYETGAGARDSVIQDIQLISAETPVYAFDVTAAARDWYDAPDTNYGVSISAIEGVTYGTSYFTFYSANSSFKPEFAVVYRDMKGVESYWPYSSHSAGTAGVGSINLATGQLSLAIPTLTTTTGIMPYTVSLVYNSGLAGKNYISSETGIAYTTAHTPYGFKLNIGETITQSFLNRADGVSVSVYNYTDADGTEHALYPAESYNEDYAFTDEDGLGINLSFDANNDPVITDRDKITRRFDKISYNKWYLSSIEDVSGNAIVFTVDSSYRPTKVSLDPAGNVAAIDLLELRYNTGGRISMVYNPSSYDAVVFRYASTYNGTSFTQSGAYLRGISYAHGNGSTTTENWDSYISSNSNTTNITEDSVSIYHYDLTGNIIAHKNSTDNVWIIYEITSSKYTSVEECSNEIVSIGQSLRFSYGNGYTDVRSSGNDDIIDNTDDIITRYVLDRYGRANSVYSFSDGCSEIYGATMGVYDTGESSKNSLKQQATLGNVSVNYLVNGGFESSISSSSNWTLSGSIARYSGYSNIKEGDYVLRMTPSAGATARLYQIVTLSAGDYTVSFPYSTTNCENTTLTLEIKNSSGTVVHSENLGVSPDGGGGVASFFSTTFTVASTGKYTVNISAVTASSATATPIIYLDNVMLESGIGADDYTMVTYGGMEQSGNTSRSSVWTGSGFAYAIDAEPFETTIRLSGSVGGESYAKQRIYTAPSSLINSFNSNPDSVNNAGARYLISGFAKADQAALGGGSKLALRLDVTYYQGSGEEDVVVPYYVSFAKGVTDWQFASGEIETGVGLDVSSGARYNCVRYIDVVCEYSYQKAGSYAYFDNISVTKDVDDFSKYTYDENGNVTVVEGAHYHEYYVYDSDNNVVKYANSLGNLIEYTYTSSGLVSIITKYYVDNATELEHEDYANGTITKTVQSRTNYSYNTYGLITSEYSRQLTPSYSQESGTYPLEYTYSYNLGSGSKIFGTVYTETQQGGSKTQYSYNSRGLLTSAINITDGTGYAYNYDDSGKLFRVLPMRYVETSNAYSAFTNAEKVNYTYDSAGRLSTISTVSTTYTITYDAFGNTESVNAGDNTLATYTYNQYNGKLNTVEYGNGHIEEYVYDTLENISEIWYTVGGVDTLAYSYEYNADGTLYKLVDNVNDKSTVYRYDSSGRITNIAEYDGNDSTNYVRSVYYDPAGRVASSCYDLVYGQGTSTQTGSFNYSYTYNGDSTLSGVSYTVGDDEYYNASYGYDKLGRVTSITKNYTSGNSTGGFSSSSDYTYEVSSSYTTSNVATYVSTVGGVETKYVYTYDARDNITSIVVEVDDVEYATYRYVYDDQNQLIREDNSLLNATYVYTYDNAGNILSKAGYALTAAGVTPTNPASTSNYGYSTSTWGDILTSYGNSTIINIAYDAIGNPTEYFNGTGYILTWEGRRLVEAETQTGYTCTFTYGDGGLRTSKTVDGVTTKYYYDGNLLISEQTSTYTIIYIYDANGSPVGMQYRLNSYAADTWDVYWFEKNLQGDIVAVYDATGTKLVSYIYDAWGNLLRTYHNNGGNTGAAKNPFTYRGYYYDYDLELYYLQTRYYDPVVGRFINADALMSGTTGNLHGNNLYAYCFNNPINMIDSSGSWPTWNDIKSTFIAVVEWVNTKIIQPVVAFVNDVVEDVENYDLNNESEDKVLESNYFSSYKGVFVIRTDLDRSGSFGAIFLTREANDRKNPEDVVRHEYGHTKQLEQLGILHYTMCILIPSWQKWGTGEYYSKPWEVTADVYGGVQSRTHSQSTIDDSFAYLKRSKRLGVIVWLFIE